MSPETVRWLVALAVLGHGVGHVLFMPMLNAALRLDASGHSWLLSGLVGSGPTRLAATVVAGALIVAFTLAAGGILIQVAWWRGLLVVAAIASIALTVTMWDGILTGPASAALAFDAVILVALLVLHWPGADIVQP